MIAEVIYECTGHCYDRKKVSSHLQHLRRMSSRMPGIREPLRQQIVQATAEFQEANLDDTAVINRVLGRIQRATYALARVNDEKKTAALPLTQRRRREKRGQSQAQPKSKTRPNHVLLGSPGCSLFHQIFRFTLDNDHELSLQPLRQLGSNFLALSRVDQFHRVEVLQYIESHLCFDFTWDTVTLGLFCTHMMPIHRQKVQHVAIEFVDTETPNVPTSWTSLGTYLSDNLPSLRSINLTLNPRDPNRQRRDDFQWTQQTEQFLSSFGDVTANIILRLYWKEDCDYFEGNYLGVRGWKCIQCCQIMDEPEEMSVQLVSIYQSLLSV